MLKKILVPLTGADTDSAALAAAFAVAGNFNAHVNALFVRIDPRDAVPVMGEGLSGALIEEIMRAAETEANRDAEVARQQFQVACNAAKAELVETPPGPDAVSAALRERLGSADEVVAREGRLADLIVLPKPKHDPSMITLEAAMLGTARPLLMAPPSVPARIGSTVAIAWNGGIESARAVSAAMPFLVQADAVHVLTAETSATRGEEADQLTDYLAWHGVQVRTSRFKSLGAPVGATLLNRAGELGADLLVMGGYGHSRMRELILGGVTRHVLAYAEMPILLAH
jgi:nucleotide-binding universal stress UspA family protein